MATNIIKSDNLKKSIKESIDQINDLIQNGKYNDSHPDVLNYYVHYCANEIKKIHPIIMFLYKIKINLIGFYEDTMELADHLNELIDTVMKFHRYYDAFAKKETYAEFIIRKAYESEKAKS